MAVITDAAHRKVVFDVDVGRRGKRVSSSDVEVALVALRSRLEAKLSESERSCGSCLDTSINLFVDAQMLDIQIALREQHLTLHLLYALILLLQRPPTSANPSSTSTAAIHAQRAEACAHHHRLHLLRRQSNALVVAPSSRSSGSRQASHSIPIPTITTLDRRISRAA